MSRMALRVQGPRLRWPSWPGRPVAAARRRVPAAVDPVGTAVLATLEAAPRAAGPGAMPRRAQDLAARAAALAPAFPPGARVVARALGRVEPVALRAALAPGQADAMPGAAVRRGAWDRPAALSPMPALPGDAVVRVMRRAVGRAAAPARMPPGGEVATQPYATPDLPALPAPALALARRLDAPGPALRVAAAGTAPISPVRVDTRPVAPRAARALPPGADTAERDAPSDTASPAAPSGTVLLDGQLVGQWLMDRMARDAERPPAGLTGFDVRQAPAWSLG